MLLNYLRTYSSALCQIRRHLRSENMAKVYPKSWFWMHAFDWPEQTLKIYMQSYVFLPVTMICAVLCWQTYLGMYSSAFATFEPWRSHLKRATSAKGSQKSEYYMLAFDWLEQTDIIGCNIFPARMTCAELWCQIVWEHFPQLCVKFQPWRRQLGNMFLTTPYF